MGFLTFHCHTWRFPTFYLSAFVLVMFMTYNIMLLTLNRETKFILSDICFPFIQQNDFSNLITTQMSS